ncbi:hypothetical protein [Burkholderia sp. MS455]|nr:hypothetical protein [Burkholderia sp. MS455]
MFSPRQLAGELLASTLNDEPGDKSVISHLLPGAANAADADADADADAA